MTKYYLDRNEFIQDGTFGGISAENGEHICVTVERPITGDHPCIAPGTYTFNAFQSPTKGDVWLRDDAAANDGRSMIEIHAANWAQQLLGCIAVGESVQDIEGVQGVTNSKATLAMLKQKLPDSFQLVISGEPV